MQKLEQPHKPEVIDPIIEQIKNEPSSYDQTDWGYKNRDTSCGTACCIAGWAVTNELKSKGIVWTDFSDELICSLEEFEEEIGLMQISESAAKILGIRGYQADLLFSMHPDDNWHLPWSARWERALEVAEPDETFAEIAIDLLEHIRDYGPTAILGE